VLLKLLELVSWSIGKCFCSPFKSCYKFVEKKNSHTHQKKLKKINKCKILK
jgi:hypothetical protein